MKWKSITGVAFSLLVAGAAAAYLLHAQRPATASMLMPDDEQVVQRGELVYRVQCAACHGPKLEGQPNWRERGPDSKLPAPPHDATGHTWHHHDAQLFRLTKFGPAALVGGSYESNMPGYAEVLSDADIVAVLSFIKSTWPSKIRGHHDDINERARASKRK